jgi:2-(1,2-epoxy-1,2-dihydrophenyl)acetyl-CoA isomerase
MIYKVFPDEIFAGESMKLADSLSQMPTKGLAYTKHLLNESFSATWKQQLLLEDEFQQKAAATFDYNEGINSFLEKRPPNFRGE